MQPERWRHPQPQGWQFRADAHAENALGMMDVLYMLQAQHMSELMITNTPYGEEFTGTILVELVGTWPADFAPSSAR